MASEVVIVRRHTGLWTIWRDVVMVMLIAGLMILAVQYQDLSRHFNTSAALRTRQLAALTAQLGDLQRQLAVKDDRIKQLTDQLLRAHIAPEPAPPPTAFPRPEVSPQPSHSREPSPEPSPSRQPVPSPSRRPTLRSSATCMPLAVGVCLPRPTAPAHA